MKMIKSEKIDEYCTRVMNVVNEMRKHDNEISGQQVMKKISISVIEKYEYFMAITEETKHLSKLSVKELVHMRSEEFFMGINQKR